MAAIFFSRHETRHETPTRFIRAKHLCETHYPELTFKGVRNMLAWGGAKHISLEGCETLDTSHRLNDYSWHNFLDYFCPRVSHVVSCMFHATFYVFHALAARTCVFNCHRPCHRLIFLQMCETRLLIGVRNTWWRGGAKHTSMDSILQGCETLQKGGYETCTFLRCCKKMHCQIGSAELFGLAKCAAPTRG